MVLTHGIEVSRSYKRFVLKNNNITFSVIKSVNDNILKQS